MIRKAKHLFYPFGAAVHCFLCRNRITAIAGRNQNGSNSPATFLSSARIFIFCGQRFSHAPHSLHKLAKWWLGRKPAVVFIYWLFPVFSGWRPHCMPQNKRDIHPIGAGHAIAAGRAGNPERGTKRLGYASYTACFSAPMEPGSASPATFTFSASCSRVLIPLSTTVTSG